jgi:hypothetical protein
LPSASAGARLLLLRQNRHNTVREAAEGGTGENGKG